MAKPQKKLLVRSQEEDPERAPCAPQEKSQIQKDLWRIEDVLAGLSVNKENYRILVGSVKNPGKTASHLPGIGHGGAGGMACAETVSVPPFCRFCLYPQKEKRCLCSLTHLCLHSLQLRASQPCSPALPPAPCGRLWRSDSFRSCRPMCHTDLTRLS